MKTRRVHRNWRAEPIRRHCALCLGMGLALLYSASAVHADPPRDEVLAAMKKATTFMVETVALNGGYVWVVSEDLAERWGEVPARPSQIWLQGGTERVGQVLLDAYEATGDASYLHGARKAADALIFGQHHLGGWHYFVDFDPKGVPEWYEKQASRYRYGYEEYRHYYGNATYDDRVTPDAALFLLRFYRTTLEAAYRAPVLKALDFVMDSQYPNGAWPQRYPLRYDYAHDGLPDYTSFFTLNDGAADANIELLLEAYDTLGDARYFDAARRGVDAVIALQGPDGQACWAEQYGPDMRPATARTHEPAGYVVRESRDAIALLQAFYLRTGDARYLAPVPRCLDWFDRINRESIAERYPTPRYWEPGTNRPVYVVRTGKLTPEGYGAYTWVTDPSQTRCGSGPCQGDGTPIVDVSALRAEHGAIAALTTAEARAARLATLRRREPGARGSPGSVEQIIGSMDARGAWVSDEVMVLPVPKDGAMESGERVPVRGIATSTFVGNMSRLMASVRDRRAADGPPAGSLRDPALRAADNLNAEDGPSHVARKAPRQLPAARQRGLEP
jgi:PelA/Pel-15E family pectate lyase